MGGNGIVGCKGLKKTDHIHLFYTENAKKISLDFFEDHGEAELVIHKVPVRKQSLDMHLVSFLGFLIGQDGDEKSSYKIVSKDTDYDNIIKFWKQEKDIDAARIANIKSANRSVKTKTAVQKQNPPLQPAKGSVQKVQQPAGKPAKASDTDIKTRLNNELQQILSKEGGYASEVVCDVAKLSVGLFGDEHFQQRVHNELQTKYENYSDIYTLIKPILDRSVSKKPQEPQEARQPAEPKDVDRMELNSQIQKALSRAGLPPEVVGFVASTVVRNSTVKNGKQVIYRSILSKFGKKQGLDIYRTVKKQIPY